MTEYEVMEYTDWLDLHANVIDANKSMMKIAVRLMETNADKSLLEIVAHVVRLQDAVEGQCNAVIDWYNQDKVAT